MYAIIQTGGKQYRVEQGDEIDVELLKSEENGKVSFNHVLLCNDGKETHVGTPKLENFLVEGELLGNVKGPKVIAFKYKRRKNYRLKKGHRQKYHRVKITQIAAK